MWFFYKSLHRIQFQKRSQQADQAPGEFDMMLNRFRNLFIYAASSVVLAGSALAASTIKNVVLVHGAFVDGSGWKPVYDILVRDGYSVTVVQDPLTSLAEDVAATKRVLDRQPGQCILVGHSYGGAVITEAGTDYHVACTCLTSNRHRADPGLLPSQSPRRL
jgi:pimeloyl-ACP methyl ester carboxylesterase